MGLSSGIGKFVNSAEFDEVAMTCLTDCFRGEGGLRDVNIGNDQLDRG